MAIADAKSDNDVPAAALAQQDPRAFRQPANLFSNGIVQFLALLAFSILIRSPLYGDWNHDIDEQYYVLIGQRMLDGATLYVDIWDRKGPALYLFYALVATISRSTVAAQLAATLCAAAGGYGVNRIACLIAKPSAAFLAGLAYCALLNQFSGENLQCEVLFNPLVIAGAWSIATRVDLLRTGKIDVRIALGMAALGLAISFKQSVAIPAVGLGLVVAFLLIRSKAPRGRLAQMLALLTFLGCLPMLATFAWYGAQGQFSPMWQALVTSNLTRSYFTTGDRIWFLAVLAGRMALPLAFATVGTLRLFRTGKNGNPALNILVFWALVTIAGLVAFPAVFLNYGLALLPSLCVLCASFIGKSELGLVAGGALIVSPLFLGGTFGVASSSHSRAKLATFERYTEKETPNHRLFVWGVPNMLYARLDSRPPTPLLLAPLFYEASEKDASGRSPESELRRVLEWAPETVVYQDPLPILDPNPRTVAMMRAYLRKCRQRRRFELTDRLGPQVQWVYSRCSPHPHLSQRRNGSMPI